MLPQVGICIAIQPDSSRPSKMGHLLNVNFAVVFHIPKKGEWPRKIQRLQGFVISWQVLRAWKGNWGVLPSCTILFPQRWLERTSAELPSSNPLEKQRTDFPRKKCCRTWTICPLTPCPAQCLYLHLPPKNAPKLRYRGDSGGFAGDVTPGPALRNEGEDVVIRALQRSHRIHGAGICANIKGVYWWDPWHTIYSSTMDPMGMTPPQNLHYPRRWWA